MTLSEKRELQTEKALESCWGSSPSIQLYSDECMSARKLPMLGEDLVKRMRMKNTQGSIRTYNNVHSLQAVWKTS